MPTTPDRPADQLHAALTAAVVETMLPRYGAPQHNTPGGLSLTATPEEARLHRARPIVDAVLTALPAPALAVARQLLGTTTCGCPHPADEHSAYGCAEDCACEWMPPKTADPAELTADEARNQAADLATQLYQAQDALAFVGECCDIADRAQRPITTGDVREWLKGARCGRQLLGTSTGEDTAADAQTASYWQQKLRAVTEGRDGLKRENDRLRKELAKSERIRENADFHLGQEMARRQLAEKATAAPPAPADRAAVLRELADEAENCDGHLTMQELRRLAGEAAAGAHQTEQADTEAYPARHQWRTETHDPLADEWNQGMPYTERADAVARHQTREERFPTWKDGTRVQRRLVRVTTTYTVEPTEPPTHLPKGTNAEDCPACKGTNPDYPFLCPGPPAVPAAPEETR